MIATLIGKNVMYKITLPEFVRGNYSINDESDKKLINIESVDGNWQIVSNNNFKIIDPKEVNAIKNGKLSKKFQGKTIENVMLKEYSVYYILFNNSNEIWILYCAPTCESFIHLDVKTSSEIIIGRDKNNHISYDRPLIKNRHVRIFYSNGRLLLENFDVDYGCFINNKPARK